jgi:hypothetical protein
MSHGGMSTAGFSIEDLPCPLSEVRLRLEGREERQVPRTLPDSSARPRSGCSLPGLRAKSALVLGDYGLPHARNFRDWSAPRHAA